MASTGKPEQADWLRQLGAREVIARQDLAEPAKPLMKERWIGVIDSVGSHTLANACASTQYGGVVTCCGLAQGMDFPATVAPFILRGIRLIGIDSVMCPKETRLKAWQQLSQLDLSLLNQASQTIRLEQAIDYAYKLLNGDTCGRVVVEMGK
ncbi:zinc-binding dehydrogenase [Volucribacter amazonae]|uniref:zinc-binding dehydrogenase n=1 Tax=Volucribacter amazonae TaxID=256731 RepID=UPI002442894F|nr:zinc-binding dehydrogenase [Volucribacter amazonae]